MIEIKEDVRIGDIILEAGDRIRVFEQVRIKEGYHTSPVKISSLKNEVMWFALNEEEGLGWFESQKSERGQAYLYECILDSSIKIADERDLDKLFRNTDNEDYIIDVVGNPEPDEIMDNPGTQILIDAGYDGVVYADYDPRDFQKDLDALMIFNPKKNISNFKLIKPSAEVPKAPTTSQSPAAWRPDSEVADDIISTLETSSDLVFTNLVDQKGGIRSYTKVLDIIKADPELKARMTILVSRPGRKNPLAGNTTLQRYWYK